jgi:diguanylate cyclase (GGDEF)-like protein
MRVPLPSVARLLPHGGSLPLDEWRIRHRVLVRANWIVALLLIPYSFERGYGVGHAALHAVPIVLLGALASVEGISTRQRSVAAALALLTSAAVFVHASHGLIEAHFAFFVLIVALTLYEDWLVFVVAIVFVLLHHGVLGMIDPGAVYSGTSLSGQPWKWATIHAAFVSAAGLAAIVAWRFNEKLREELRDVAAEREQLIHRLELLARQDPLTGVANRRAWRERLVEELQRARRTGQPLAVAVLDLDGLKGVNDSDGHQAGDRLLRSAANAWQGAVRTTDYLGRIGGDEFAVAFPDCTPEHAMEVVERMLSAMPGDETCSAGVAGGDGDEAATALLRRADEALYAAKQTGPNRALTAA